MKKIILSISACFCFAVVYPQWSTNPAVANNPVIANEADEGSKFIVTDGADGAIVISQSSNFMVFPFSIDITAQRINASGVLQWGTAANPKSVISNTDETKFLYLTAAIADGSGGAYIAWTEYVDTFSNFYMQHINSSGNKLWAANGIKINRDNNYTVSTIRLCTDGAGGVVAAWDESIYNETTKKTVYSQVFAQRYNSAGAKQWGANPVQVCTNAGLRAFPSLVYDGSAYVIYFADTRNSNQFADDDFDNIDIFAQRLNTSGGLTWAAAGLPVANAALNQVAASSFYNNGGDAIADGQGGSMIIFSQYTMGTEDLVKYFAQRLNSAGARQWATAGVSVSSIETAKQLVKTVSDGAAGIVATWADYGNSFSNPASLYAQRITSAGSASWTANGVNIVPNPVATGDCQNPDMTDDGSGGYVITWSRGTLEGSSEVMAQKLSSTGTFPWGNTPKPVCTNSNARPDVPSIVKSNAASTIIAWLDQRNGITNYTDVFAGKLASDGSLGGSTPVATTYTFTGNGNWNVAANWSNNTIPPATLPSGSTITINHTVGGQCVLNISQTIAAGATLTVLTGKNLVVQGNLRIQ
jgi:hypothetical protein